jgi:hypothetical protein
MADQGSLNPNEIQIITGHQLGAHPFYRERSELDTLKGHDWLMLLSLGLTCAMGFRLAAIVLQLLNYPVWMIIFFGVLLSALTLMAEKLRYTMPLLLGAIALTSAIGSLLGFLL